MGYTNPFFDPGQASPNGFDGFNQTPATQGFFDQNPQAAYTASTAPFAGGGDTFSKWVQSMYGQANQGYNASLSLDPTLHAQQYYQRYADPQFWINQFANLSQQQRGEQWNVMAPPTRWIAH